MPLNPQPPDPKEVIDSIGDGASQLITIGPRIAKNFGDNANRVGEGFKAIGAEVERRMLDDPSVLPETIIKGVGVVVDGIIGGFKGIASAVDETAEGVRKNIERVTKK